MLLAFISRNTLTLGAIGINITYFRYDPKTDNWTIIAPINSPRDAVAVCLLGDKLFAVGGCNGQQYLSDVECYDPQNNSWSPVRYIKL